MTTRSASRRWLLLSGILLVVVGIGGYVAWRKWGSSQLDAAQLVALKDRAVGLAENAKYAEADELFQQLALLVPNEPLVLRNLAVVRVGQFEVQQDQQQGADANGKSASVAPERVVEAVIRLLKAEPNEPASHILASRAAVQLDRLASDLVSKLPDPLDSLRTAAKHAPQDAAVRYELFKLAQTPKYNKDIEVQKEAREALADAHEIQPRNLTLLFELLMAQCDPAVADPKVAVTLEEAKQVLLPLREIILRLNARIDVELIIQEAQTAAEQRNWVKVRQRLGPMVNVSRISWPQRTDQKRVNVGALEYLRYEFSDDTQSRLPKEKLPGAAEADITFATAGANFPPLDGVRDLRVVDVDLDGRMDLVVLHGNQVTVLSRPRMGDSWETLLKTDVAPGMVRLLVADLDRDEATLPPGLTPKVDRQSGVKQPGDEAVTDTLVDLASTTCQQAFPDFLLFGNGGICIVRNQIAGKSAEASSTGGLKRKLTLPTLANDLKDIGNVTAALLADFDHDQDLDLVLGVEGQGVRLWRMLGNGTFKFEDYTQWSTIPPIAGQITAFALVDWDRDLYSDIFVNYQTPGAKGDESAPMPILLRNQRHGQFLGAELEMEFAALRSSVSMAPLEVDGNVSWDLAAVTASGVGTVLTTTPEPGKVTFLRSLPAVPTSGNRLLTWDFDNDTFSDLLTWNEQAVSIFRCTADGIVAFDSTPLKFDAGNGLRAVDYGDMDNDGDLDLVLATADRMQLLVNQGGNTNRWLKFFVTGDFDGQQDVGANNSALGTTVEVQTSGRYQAQVITRQPVHVGLGTAVEAKRVRLLFTNGIPRSVPDARANTLFCQKQILGGSCPFVYTWSGEAFTYFSDCLWAAPIGLQVAEGKMAPSRAWEYLLLPGERLTERDGTYDLQLTEELWEAAYFDEVKLIAVDHPADTDLYTNEKVGGPDIAAPKLHLVKQPRRPVAARDKHGRDVLATVSQRDDVYLRGFDQHITQGLVDEHFLELELGAFESPPKLVTLFLTGWIYPTNTSINVNLSQHPDLEYPRLPYVHVADGNGGWKEAQAFMGFPGGKTKTIAVELPGEVFTGGQHKLRICTSAEIYWDDVFFTVDEEPIVGQSPQINEHVLPLLSADLHYRGFSRELPHHPDAPLRFDYQTVSTEPKWPPMEGCFTRYGDVRPLLASADDQMVVMGSGDEMTVRFRVPAEQPPAGWKRDFILYSVGWDKDADLNTVYGQTAEPLPYNAMPSYPYPPDQWYPDTPATRGYLREYQTRKQDHHRFLRELAR
jgi:hypothetical protein